MLSEPANTNSFGEKLKYIASLENHLSALLESHPDKALAARVRDCNFPPPPPPAAPIMKVTDPKNQKLTREEFDRLKPADQSSFILAGGTLTDTASAANVTAADVATKPKTRAEFDQLTAAEQSAYCLAGRSITD